MSHGNFWQHVMSIIIVYLSVIVILQALPVATDATCSGLQILAGLARDKNTAS
jgi:hypothetical protein